MAAERQAGTSRSDDPGMAMLEVFERVTGKKYPGATNVGGGG
jgi:hypothetical protein